MTKKSLITQYRPENWEQLIGHDEQVRAFKAALPHSRLFILVGQSGVGKTTFARLGAQEAGATRVNEIDAATWNGVDDMRELTAGQDYHPLVGGDVCVNIVDEAHRLSQPAWTVLAKPI